MQFSFGDLMTTIEARKSVRRFRDEVVSSSDVESLLEDASLRRLAIAPCRVQYISSPDGLDDVFTGIVASYGKIKGAKSALCLMSSSLTKKEHAHMEAGFLGEQYVLRAQKLGLGTCWVAGTFNYKKLMRYISVGPDESVQAIIAVGIPEGNKEGVRNLLHNVVRKKKAEDIASQELRQGPDWLRAALFAAGRAPSAINLQPWYFYGTPDRVALRPSRKGSFTAMDLGIAMLHFQIVIQATGHKGEWEFDGDTPYMIINSMGDDNATRNIVLEM